MRDWPPCPPIQRGGGRRSRPGVTPFISALTVARCPATFPGVWPQLRDTLSTSRSVGRGTGAFIYLPPFSENRPIFCSFPFAKIQPVFLPEQTGRKKHRTPFPPSATPAGITHYTLQAKSCAKGIPFGNPILSERVATLPPKCKISGCNLLQNHSRIDRLFCCTPPRFLYPLYEYISQNMLNTG